MRICICISGRALNTMALIITMLVFSAGPCTVLAAEKGAIGGVLQVPPAGESMSGAPARMRGGGLNETGTWDCSCSGGQGTCEINRLPDRITCVKGSGTCTGTCKIKSSTTGIGGAGTIMQ